MKSIVVLISSKLNDEDGGMMNLKDLEKTLSGLVMDLEPAPENLADATHFESVDFDRAEKDNARWIELIAGYLNTAKIFEIHCWNEEQEWIEWALQYVKLKDDSWKCGKIITGEVTPEFAEMLLSLLKPTDIEIYNKMTPLFNVFLDDVFQSCHYGTENYCK